MVVIINYNSYSNAMSDLTGLVFDEIKKLPLFEIYKKMVELNVKGAMTNPQILADAAGDDKDLSMMVAMLCGLFGAGGTGAIMTSLEAANLTVDQMAVVFTVLATLMIDTVHDEIGDSIATYMTDPNTLLQGKLLPIYNKAKFKDFQDKTGSDTPKSDADRIFEFDINEIL